MMENEGQSSATARDEKPEPELSPSEKIEGDKSGTGSLVPGQQNPESEEIKEEKSPNTE